MGGGGTARDLVGVEEPAAAARRAGRPRARRSHSSLHRPVSSGSTGPSPTAPGPAELAAVAADEHARLERDQVGLLDRHVPAGPAARLLAGGAPGDVLPQAGVVIPAAAIASMKTPVNWRSVTPGASASTAAASAPSATRTAARMASTSSGAFTRRTRRSSGSPSTSSAEGNALGQQVRG